MYKKKTHLVLFLIIFCFLPLLLTTCKPKTEPDCTPGKSDRTEGCDQFTRVKPFVRYGKASLSSLPIFNQTGWHPFEKDYAVSTSSSGVAEINFSDCWPGRIFCFRNTNFNFRVEKCNNLSGSGTPLGCLAVGQAYTNGPCPAEYTVIYTGSARIIKEGTVFAITYLPDNRDITLLIVLEGRAKIEPAVSFDPTVLDDPDDVPAGMFYFTMPNEQLSPVGGLDPRQAYPIEMLPPVVEELDIWDWMFDVRDQAERDGVLPENWPPELGGSGVGPGPDNQIFVNSGGGALADTRVQEAMLNAVNWPEVAAASGLDSTQITGFVGGDPIDLLPDAPFDPDLARELLAVAGYPNGVGMTIFYPAGDAELAKTAEIMRQFFAESGFDGTIQEATAEIDTRLAMMEAAGESFIIIER